MPAANLGSKISPIAVNERQKSMNQTNNPRTKSKAKTHKGGRRKGGGVGAWHRTGRGWYAGRDPAIPLRDLDGNHIKDKSARREADEAYARHLIAPTVEAKAGGGELTVAIWWLPS